MPNCLVSCLQEEVEPFPEERENFLQQLYKFMEDRGESRAGTSVMFEVYFHLWDGLWILSSFFFLLKRKIIIFSSRQTCCAAFLTTSTYAFCFSSSGTPINKRPVLGYRNLNLFKLYRLVHKLGGFDNVSATARPWEQFDVALVSFGVDSLWILSPPLSRLRAVLFGSKSIRIWESPCSTQLLATTSNVLTASTYRHSTARKLSKCKILQSTCFSSLCD